MHGFFLQHFACAIVDTVEISAPVGDMARRYFDLDDVVCQVYRNLDDLATSARPTKACRSRVFIADFRSYLELYSQHMDSLMILSSSEYKPENHDDGALGYDIIAVDAFDSLSLTWSGTVGEGVSNGNHARDIDNVYSMTHHLKRLLRHRQGISAYHLHIDSTHQGYLDALERSFGHKVASFSVQMNNNVMITSCLDNNEWCWPSANITVATEFLDGGVDSAGRSRVHIKPYNHTIESTLESSSPGDEFLTLTKSSHPFGEYHPHPCDNPTMFIDRMIATGERQGYSPQAIYNYVFALRCSTFY